MHNKHEAFHKIRLYINRSILENGGYGSLFFSSNTFFALSGIVCDEVNG